MKLDKGMTVGALPIQALRDFLRETPDTSFSTDFAEDNRHGFRGVQSHLRCWKPRGGSSFTPTSNTKSRSGFEQR